VHQLVNKRDWYFDYLSSRNICKQLLIQTCVGTESECFPKLALASSWSENKPTYFCKSETTSSTQVTV